jgi:hypothetical protein
MVITPDSSTQNTVDWTNNGDLDYDGVRIERSINEVDYSTIHKGVPGLATYVDTGLSPGILYYYRISYYRDSLKVVYEPELKQYKAGILTDVSIETSIKLNTLVSTVKAGLSITALSQLFDQFIPIAGESDVSSLRNLVANANHCTLIGSPSFTAFEGFRTNGTDNAIRTNMATGSRCVQNSAYYGVYFRDNSTAAGMLSGSDITWFYTGRNSEFNRCRCNGTAYDVITLTWAAGLKSTARNTATNHMHYINGVGGNAYEPSATPTLDPWLGAANNGAGGVNFHVQQFSFYVSGAYLNTTQDAVVRNAIEAYMDSNGKGVIV